jgi:hypothetical protein
MTKIPGCSFREGDYLWGDGLAGNRGIDHRGDDSFFVALAEISSAQI